MANYPGITVERKYANVKHENKEFVLHDLPGTYSLTAYSQEEVVTRDFIIKDKPELIVQVVDASNLQRNLYLTIQLLEMNVPVVIALNMLDVAEKRSKKIDYELLSKKIGVPVVPTVARSRKGKNELLESISKYNIKSQELNITKFSYGNDIDEYLEEAVEIIGKEEIESKWTALKYLEADDEIISQHSKSTYHQDLSLKAKKLEDHIRATLDTYPEGIIADYRYGIVRNIISNVITDKDQSNRIYFSDMIDKVLTQRLIGPIILLLILYFTYEFTFWASEYPTGLLESFFGYLRELAENTLSDGLIKSLIISGIIDGVGGVLGFTPLIFFMFFVIAILEDSGYMARMAYMLDRVFKFFGLQGNSVVPFIVSGGIAGGCAVPGVMAARTIKGNKERLLTILTAPFMACGAKIPVFALLVSAFFIGDKGLAMLGITILSWVFALVIAKIYGSTIIKGKTSSFIMEIPPYRFPTLKGLLLHAWERTWMYIKKAGTIILAISVILWIMMTFPRLDVNQDKIFENKIKTTQSEYSQEIIKELETNKNEDKLSNNAKELKEKISLINNEKAGYALKNSIAGRIGTSLEPLSKFAGFDWRTNIALVGGFAAKEVVISTLGTAYSLGEVDPENTDSLSAKLKGDPKWNLGVALALIFFTILYAPCFVTVIAIVKETASYKWGVFSVVSNTLIAYIFAVIAYQIFG